MDIPDFLYVALPGHVRGPRPISKTVLFETALFPLPTNNIANHALYIPWCVFGIPLLLPFLGFPLSRFSSRCQGIDSQQYPAIFKQLFTLSYSCLLPYLSNISVYRHFLKVWLLHTFLQNPVFLKCIRRKERGCRPSAVKGLRFAPIHFSALASKWTRS